MKELKFIISFLIIFSLFVSCKKEATNEYVFVSNGNNDCISVIDVKTNKIKKDIFLNIDDRIKKYRGIIPFGLALSPDMKRLYVAESGLNAVGVIDVGSLNVMGHIPVGWFPAKLQVTKDGKKLIISNAKGTKSGNEVGLTLAETESLSDNELYSLIKAAETKLSEAGAHFIINGIWEAEKVLEQINENIGKWLKP